MNQESLNKIGFFQFDNLVKNRVPFCLVNFGQSTTQYYTGLSRTHIEGVEMICSLTDYKQKLDERKLPKDFAIVLLCSDGQLARNLIPEFLSQGFGNAYYVDGGVNEFPKLKN